MKILLIVIAVLIVVAVLGCCKVAGKCSRREEKDPCEFCVRWYECNGVDDECPWKV